jgi:hypothetical protein
MVGLAAAALTPETARVSGAGALSMLGLVVWPVMAALAIGAAVALAGPPALRLGGRVERSRHGRSPLHAARAVVAAGRGAADRPARTLAIVAGCVAAALAAAVTATIVGGWGLGRRGIALAEARIALDVLVALSAATAVAAFLLAARGGRLVRRAAPVLAAGAFVAPAALDFPLDAFGPLARGQAAGADVRLVTGDVTLAMRWIRDRSDPDAVLVVNNQFLDPARADARYFFYAALAERRTFLGGWHYSPLGYVTPATSPELAARDRLNRAALCGDPVALRTLHDREGVRFVVVDKRVEPAPARVGTLARVFSNRDVDVYGVTPAALAVAAPVACLA